MAEYTIIKLGGSLMSPGGSMFDTTLVAGYVKGMREFYAGTREGRSRLVLVVGGGNLSREYRDFADTCGEDSNVDRHRIGITATWLNAELIRSLIDQIAFKRVLGVGVYAENRKDAERMMAKDFEEWLAGDLPVLVSGGFINGASTDFNAVLLASKIGADRFHKLTNVDYVYREDPKKNPQAEPLKDISWAEFFRLFEGSLDEPEFKPGAHIPIDLFAAKLAFENKINCLLSDGRDPSVLQEILEGKELPGTSIHP